MRNSNFKLIRKTLEWRHRLKGYSSVTLPVSVSSESFRFLKIYGHDAESPPCGVGLYDEDLASYTVPIHVHGKNLMGGEEFVAIHSALNVSKVAGTVIAGFYSTTPMPDYNGTVIIGPKHVTFKEKTPYTLAIHFKFFTSATKRRIAMRFDYSDGTYDVPVIDSTAKEFRMCFTSDATKNLVAISSHAETTSNIRISVEGFGLYEGVYTDYNEAHEAYEGYRATALIDAPLLKIDYSADEADIVNGRITRKIKRLIIDGTSSFSETDNEGIFETTLPSPMRIGGRIVSPYPALTEDCDSGLSGNEDGEKILFKAASDIITVEALTEYLTANPFEIAYVLRDYEEKACEPLIIPPFDKALPLDVLSSAEPSKIVAEYI